MASKELFGVTPGHVLFPEDEGKMTVPTKVRSFPWGDQGNSQYTFKCRPRKDVVLIGRKAFKDFVKAIQAQFGTFNSTVDANQGGLKPAGALSTSQTQLIDM